MGTIEVLDVTLRDGGCVNDFNFGCEYMEKILIAQENAHIDIIELGYLDEKGGDEFGRTKFIDEKVIYKSVLKEKKRNYVVMMDYGRFNPDNLEKRNNRGIDGIRLAFHKKDVHEAIEVGKKIIEKGYDLYIQPMITLRYSDRELLDLIDLVNTELPDTVAFYIVDSFGEMRSIDVERVWNIVVHNLSEKIKIGFHSHNNLQLSYSNAMDVIRMAGMKNIIIDSSIMGMGKGAGNLNTELLLEHLNIFNGTGYDIAPLLEIMDKVVNQLHAEFGWGYAPEYYLSAINQCSPTYASYFYNRHMLPIYLVDELLGRIADEKKISFDKNYAELLYRQFNMEKEVDDFIDVKKIADDISNRKVLIVAPGKSMCANRELIKEYENQEDIVMIGLNIPMDIDFDYVLTTREDIYMKLLLEGKKVIVTSNISMGGRGNVYVLNYKNWIMEDGEIRDSSLVVILKLMKCCGVKDIMLAGFDGFSSNINENYYDPYLRHPISDAQANDYNVYYKNLIREYINQGFRISFLTPSKYDDRCIFDE